MASHLPNQAIFAMCVKSMNETLGPGEFVLSALVSGVYPSTQIFKEPRDPSPTLHERAKFTNMIRLETNKQMVTLRVSRAFQHNVPPATDIIHHVGDQVLMFCEKQVNNRIEDRLSPPIVKGADLDRKLVYVELKEGESPKAFRTAQVERYFRFESVAHAFFR